MPEDCCPTIRVSGAERSELNQLYTITNRIFNNRPSYIGRYRGIWWDGGRGEDGNWIIAPENFIDTGNQFRFIQNNEDTICPSYSQHWMERLSSGWVVNDNAQVYCDGTYQ